MIMRAHFFLPILIMAALLIDADSAAASVTKYNDRSSWEASVGQITTIGFEGIAAPAEAVAFPGSAGLEISGVKFRGIMSFDGPNGLRVVDPGVDESVYDWGSGAVLDGPGGAEFGAGSNLRVDFTGGAVHAFAADLMTVLPTGRQIQIYLSTGQVYHLTPETSPTRSFIGFVSKSPIAFMNFSTQSGEPIIDNFSVATLAGEDPGTPVLSGESPSTIQDVIAILQDLVNQTDGSLPAKADVNNDGRIGAAEAVYGLQRVAEMREFSLSSDGFAASEAIPSKFTCDGADVSPALSWRHAPVGTRSFVLIMNDVDAPGEDWVHWIVYNIPSAAVSLPENAGQIGDGNLPAGAHHGKNSWASDNTYYRGPCPPTGPHDYHFNLYALDVPALNPSDNSKAGVIDAMSGSILGQSELTGHYTKAVPTFTLTVQTSGPGSGTVTGTGIDCGADCLETVPSGSQIVLTAAPETGSHFSRWTGCDAANGSSCRVTIGEDRVVTAAFGTATGTWSIAAQVDERNCGGSLYTEYYPVTTLQQGSNISLTMYKPARTLGPLNGTVSGNQLHWNTSYPEDGGTTHISINLNLLDDNTVSGTSTWTWVDPYGWSCAGTDQIQGTRQ